jgi:4-O-dimethylallyl-L-tyrosine synthase
MQPFHPILHFNTPQPVLRLGLSLSVMTPSISVNTRLSNPGPLGHSSDMRRDVNNFQASITGSNIAWNDISKILEPTNRDVKFWWETSGAILGMMLESVSLDLHLQYHHLFFYYCILAPALGKHPSRQSSYKSFMTDDFTPLEFSFSWDGTKSTVRLSIEPIGPETGGSEDHFNTVMAEKLIRHFSHSSMNLDLQLFNHFRRIFGVSPENANKLDEVWDPAEPRSQIFLGFDLDFGKITTKAYFVPMLKAMESGKSRLQLVSEGISELDSQGIFVKGAFAVFEEYLTSCPPQSQPEVEMVAIDCKKPRSSRIKIYTRSRSTSFDTVRDVYTLGGRLNSASMHEELSALENSGAWCWALPMTSPQTMN